MPRLNLIDPDPDRDVDELPTYNRGTYNPHPAMSGKLRAEVNAGGGGGSSDNSGPSSPSASQFASHEQQRQQYASQSQLQRNVSISVYSDTTNATFIPGGGGGGGSGGGGGGYGGQQRPPPIDTARRPIPILDGPSPMSSETPGRSPRPPLTVQIPPGHGQLSSVVPVQQQYAAHGQMVYAPAPHLAVGRDPSTFVCHYCGSMQQTKITPVKGDYTMQMTILVGIFTCLWCLPGQMASCKDVQHSCGNCERALSTWQRHDGKVVPANGQTTAAVVPSYAQEMRPVSLRR